MLKFLLNLKSGNMIPTPHPTIEYTWKLKIVVQSSFTTYSWCSHQSFKVSSLIDKKQNNDNKTKNTLNLFNIAVTLKHGQGYWK